MVVGFYFPSLHKKVSAKILFFSKVLGAPGRKFSEWWQNPGETILQKAGKVYKTCKTKML